MLSSPSQTDKKKKILTGQVYSKKQTRVTANQHIFKSDLIRRLYLIFCKEARIFIVEKLESANWWKSENYLKKIYFIYDEILVVWFWDDSRYFMNFIGKHNL